MLYGIHIVSALIVGLFFARTPLSALSQRIHNRNRTSFPSIFCASVQQAASTALTVTAFLTMFSILLRLLSPVFALFPYGNVLDGMIELTNGLDELAVLPLPRRARLTLASFLLGFGGLAVQFQVRALAEAHDLPVHGLFAAKLLHGYARSCADGFPVFPLACRADGFLTGADTDIGTVPVYACCAVRFCFVSNLGVEKAQEMIYNILYTSCIDRHHSTGHFYH